MAEPPVWLDGEPCNLRAAAMDALLWLEILQTHAINIRMPAEDLRRLRACRAALGREIRRQSAEAIQPRPLA